MSIDTFNIASLILQGFIWAAMLGTLWVYWAQLRAIRSAATGQNILALVNFLQADRVREARTTVRDKLKSKPYGEWETQDKRAAELVCSTYDVAGILMFQEKLVPPKPFLENWGPSIQACYKILLPHILEMQKPEIPDQDIGTISVASTMLQRTTNGHTWPEKVRHLTLRACWRAPGKAWRARRGWPVRPRAR
jgi:hypothetical protein